MSILPSTCSSIELEMNVAVSYAQCNEVPITVAAETVVKQQRIVCTVGMEGQLQMNVVLRVAHCGVGDMRRRVKRRRCNCRT